MPDKCERPGCEGTATEHIVFPNIRRLPDCLIICDDCLGWLSLKNEDNFAIKVDSVAEHIKSLGQWDVGELERIFS